MEPGRKQRMERGRKPLSLVELCVRVAIDNLRHMGSVEGIEMGLLKRILPHCTLEHLTIIEGATKMDLSSITNPLWQRFYRQEFGPVNYDKVIARLEAVPEPERPKWREMFEVKKAQQKEVEDRMVEKFTKKFQAEKAEKQSKQIKMCTKVPPSSKRSFFGASGPSSLSNCKYKSPILKKARIEANSRARLQFAVQKNTSARSSQPIRTASFSGQPVRTTTIHRPNSTITMTKPMEKGRQIQNIHRPDSTITMTKPMENSTITMTKPMEKGRQIQNIHRPNSTITMTKPMGKGRQIQNSRPKF